MEHVRDYELKAFFAYVIEVLERLAACRREDFSPNTIGGKIAAIEHV